MWNSFDRSWRKGCIATLVLALGLFVGAGCEDDDDGDNTPAPTETQGEPAAENANSSVVGVWALQEGSAYTGVPYWYITFNADGTYAISNNADGSGQRVYGTYTVSGETVTGPFTNPGVGDGRIDAAYVGDDMLLDFVEYWHSPEKHVLYAGKRL
jgi:hypothetical protein